MCCLSRNSSRQVSLQCFLPHELFRYLPPYGRHSTRSECRSWHWQKPINSTWRTMSSAHNSAESKYETIVEASVAKGVQTETCLRAKYLSRHALQNVCKQWRVFRAKCCYCKLHRMCEGNSVFSARKSCLSIQVLQKECKHRIRILMRWQKPQ